MRSVLSPSYLTQYAACIALLGGSAIIEAAATPVPNDGLKIKGYSYGQDVPIACLERDLSTGEHIVDASGFLSWIPFPTCNETSRPLALRYGVSESFNCTLDSLSDEFYHTLEFYVHHDVPLSCRIPSLPLADKQKPKSDSKEKRVESKDDTGKAPAENAANRGTDLVKQKSGHPPYTPITVALQGTLQLSHLHIWNDLNVLAHYGEYPLRAPTADGDQSSKGQKKEKGKKGKKQASGQIIAATAYSLPFVKPNTNALQQPQTDDLWAPGQGTKVIRGEPLTLTLNVHWIEDDGLIEFVSASHASNRATPPHNPATPPNHRVFLKMTCLVVAAAIGAAIAIWWERHVGSGHVRWRGEGLLGHSSKSSPNMGFFHNDGKVTMGTRGGVVGYGGYSGHGTGKTD